MTLARTRTITFVAASLMVLAFSTHSDAQGNGNAVGRKSEGLAIPISTAPNQAVTGSGTFLLQKFVNDGGTVKALGIVTGTFTDGTRSVSIVRNVLLPVSISQPSTVDNDAANDPAESGPSDGRHAVAAQAVCPILHLDLGPLNLNLLGLQVDLSQVILDITAIGGAGNLLGNLLCAVTNLLNAPSAVTALTALLNDILNVLLG